MPSADRGRGGEPGIDRAELVEDETLRYHQVGPPGAWPGIVAFLDGIQHAELVGYGNGGSIVRAHCAAAVRERRERRLGTVACERRTLAIGRPGVLAAAGDALAGLELVPLPEGDFSHPAEEMAAAGRVLDRARAALEVSVGTAYRRASSEWLVVDGALSESPSWVMDDRMVGVAKHHATLPFDGAELERYLRLPYGHRSSIFAPRSRSVAPVRSWALRLRRWEGKDLFHGLVRIEVAPANATPDVADRLSGWLLGERAPLSTPDPRWDRLLYGIHSVGQYLRA